MITNNGRKQKILIKKKTMIVRCVCVVCVCALAYFDDGFCIINFILCNTHRLFVMFVHCARVVCCTRIRMAFRVCLIELVVHTHAQPTTMLCVRLQFVYTQRVALNHDYNALNMEQWAVCRFEHNVL